MGRKLAAILVADFVGSTAAMQSDEERALAQVANLLDIVSAHVAEHEGRVFNTAGDSVLAEFASPVAALRAAMEARMAIAGTPGLSAESTRFGLHVADVVSVGTDLRGDGVNVAARIQSAAEPGQILVSGLLFDHVKRNSPCGFDDLGAVDLKGLEQPVQLFRVTGQMDRNIGLIVPARTHATPDMKPNSLAVIPFATATSADEDQEFLAEGLTDEVIHALSLMRSVFVNSRTATHALRDVDPVEIGRKLGVRYTLGGSVRKLGARVRLNVSLSRTSDGEVIWSDRLQQPFDEVLDMLDKIAARVAATVSGRVDFAETSALRTKPPEKMTAYEHYLRGLSQHRMAAVSPDYAKEALKWFRSAQSIDPNFARPIAMEVCAWSYLPDFDVETAHRMALRALALDPADPELHRVLGVTSIKHDGDYEASREHHEKALKLAPSDAYIMGRCAAFYNFDGEPERALSLLERAEELDPFLPVWVIEERVAALYAMERYEEMSLEARKLTFQTRRSRFYRAAARVARGDLERATRLINEARADDPTLTTDYVVAQELYRDKATMDTLLSRLRQAGLPDAEPTLAEVS